MFYTPYKHLGLHFLFLTLLTRSSSLCPTRLHFAIGTSTSLPLAPGDGITLATFRNNSLIKIAVLSPSIAGENPTYIASSTPHLYVTNGDAEQGAARQLTFSNRVPYLKSRSVSTIGGGVAHISAISNTNILSKISGVRQVVVTADFHAGSVTTFLKTKDGFERADVFKVPVLLASQNRNPELTDRQRAPHPHMALPYKNGVLVPDLGADLLFYLGVSMENGKLTEIGRTSLKIGDGPRHVAVHEKSGAVYLVNELSNSVVVMREVQGGQFDEESRWDLLVGKSRLLEGVTKVLAAAIRVTKDGRFLYVSVRFSEALGCIVAFELDAWNGEVKSQIGSWSSGGVHPRDFYVVERVMERGKCNSYLAVANRDSSNVVLIERDVDSGKLGEVKHELNVTSPMSVLLYGQDNNDCFS